MINIKAVARHRVRLRNARRNVITFSQVFRERASTALHTAHRKVYKHEHISLTERSNCLVRIDCRNTRSYCLQRR